MLAVLEQAQGAGQKAQQDALIGQGSIFDLEPAASGAAAPAPAGRRLRRRARSDGLARVHPPIPAEEFEQAELLAVEKEAIGLFISAHPLKPMREALRARVDCSLSALADRRDKDWVTVGGIITEAKRIRTRNGDHMMFATLDDLEGAVEMLVFGKALAEHEAALAVDQVVLVRGRVDHKEAGKTCLVVQSVEAFALARRRSSGPAQADAAAQTAHGRGPAGASARRRRLSAGERDRRAQAADRGTTPVPPRCVLEIDTSAGTRRLRLGEAYRVQHTPTLRAELETRSLRSPGAGRHGLSVGGRSGSASCARRHATLVQRHGERDFLARRARAVLARGLEHARQLLRRPARTGTRAQPCLAQLALADVGVAVAV